MIDGEYWLIVYEGTDSDAKPDFFRKDKMTKNTAVLYLKRDSAVSALNLTRRKHGARIVRVHIEEVDD